MIAPPAMSTAPSPSPTDPIPSVSPVDSEEDLLKQLRQISDFVKRKATEDAVDERQRQRRQAWPLILQDGLDRPFLQVLATRTDPFLRDQACLRLQCTAEDPVKTEASYPDRSPPRARGRRLRASLRSHNRRLIREVTLDDLERDLAPLLDQLVAGASRACAGYSEGDGSDASDVWSRLRKTDIPQVLIEQYDGRLVYRARNCQYVFEVPPPDTDAESSGPALPKSETLLRCAECRRFLSELQEKYAVCSGSILDEPLPAEEVGGGEEVPKRKRGRPKGSRKKNRSDEYFVSPDSAKKPEESDAHGGKLVEELDTTLVKLEVKQTESEGSEAKIEAPEREPLAAGQDEDEDEDDNYGDEDIGYLDHLDDPNDEDYDQAPRRGKRRRTAINRQGFEVSEVEGVDGDGKRKRGRPPLVASEPVACRDCDKTFLILKDYRQHCLEHTNNFPCEFDDCVKRFKTQRDLDIHTRRHKGEKPYVCSECDDQAFSNSQDYKRHMAKHTGFRPFSCSKCDKAFALKEHLYRHQKRMHEKGKGFLCSECGKTFKTNSCLIQHHRCVHLHVKPYKCSYCGKRFSCKINLTTHVRMHTGEKPFQCQLCGTCVSRSTHLKRHMNYYHKDGVAMPARLLQKLTREKPFQCQICRKSYSRKYHLQRHLAEVHQNGSDGPTEIMPPAEVKPSEPKRHRGDKENLSMDLDSSDTCSRDKSTQGDE